MNKENLERIQRDILEQKVEKNRESLCIMLGRLAKIIQRKMQENGDPTAKDGYRIFFDKTKFSLIIRNILQYYKKYKISEEYLHQYILSFTREDIQNIGDVLNPDDKNNLLLGWMD